MKRKIIISNKEFTMPKMSIDTYTEYLDIAEQIDAHPRYTCLLYTSDAADD